MYTFEYLTSYDVNNFGNIIVDYAQDDEIFKENPFIHQMQGKVDLEIQMNQNNFLIFGFEEIYKASIKNVYDYHKELQHDLNEYGTAIPIQGPIVITETSIAGNNVLDTSAFALWNYGTATSLIQGEVGLRGEHFYLWNTEADLELNNCPIANPRANIIYTPIRNSGVFDSLSFSVGSGLYSALSDAAWEIEKEAVSDTFTLKPDTAWLSVLGSALAFDNGISLSVEGYYKYYLSRTYVYTDERDSQNVIYHAGTDGQGFAAGADFMIEKSINSLVDGYISYSFLYARFYNPVDFQYDSQTTTTGDPLEIWYYPSYHRFHTINSVLNFRLPKDCTMTISASIAAGTPAKQYIDKSEEYLAGTYNDPSIDEKLQVVLYSDTNRNYCDWPIDIRFSKEGEFNNKKGTWEWYIGIENFLSIPAALIKMNRAKEEGVRYNTTGWTIGEGNLTIDMGFFPIPSFGVKMTF